MITDPALVRSLALTVLVDDAAGPPPTEAEHELAIWIEADGFRVLFDAGAGGRIAENARHLGISLADADAFAVSHGHYDHTGGLPVVLSECGRARLYLHPGAMCERYARSRTGVLHAAGCPQRLAGALESLKDRVHWTSGVSRLHPAIFVTGEIPRVEPPEAPESRFFLDRQCNCEDPLTDDQALVIDTAGGRS
jgi:7,8-dihydropterin-6-yl-methyl-4-(beta-D-ribofuranosyl)aminobenzene 5'-phosphate synthase